MGHRRVVGSGPCPVVPELGRCRVATLGHRRGRVATLGGTCWGMVEGSRGGVSGEIQGKLRTQLLKARFTLLESTVCKVNIRTLGVVHQDPVFYERSCVWGFRKLSEAFESA